MSKGGSAAAPDFSAVAQADTTRSNNEFALGTQQLDWAKQQFNTTWPFAQDYLTQQTASSKAETDFATQQQGTYNSTYLPIEKKFADTATNYNSPDRANQNAGTATADVTAAFDAQRASSTANLESYGIDPSQTRYGALDLGTRISQAAATAGAGTQSRLNTEATGLALQGEAINIGRGYPGSIANSYNTATNSGQAGINTANNTTATGANTMGTPVQYMGLGNQALGNAGQVTAQAGQFALGNQQLQNQASAGTSSGIGSLVGAGIGAAAIII